MGSSFTFAPKQSCWKSKANFHFTARQLPDTEQMNAAANKSIKSYIKTTVLSACDLRTQTQQRRGSRGGRRSGSEMNEKLNGLEESPERGSPSAPIPEWRKTLFDQRDQRSALRIIVLYPDIPLECRELSIWRDGKATLMLEDFRKLKSMSNLDIIS